MSALWKRGDMCVVESGDVSPHSKSCARLDAPTEPWRLHQPVLIRRFASRKLALFCFRRRAGTRRRLRLGDGLGVLRRLNPDKLDFKN